MKSKLIVAISFAVLSISAKAQDNYGFYGKKNFVEVNSSSYIPLLYAFTNRGGGRKLSPSGNSLQPKGDWFNMGGRLSVGRAFETNFGMALEVGYERFTLTDNVLYSTVIDNNQYILDHESFKVHSLLIMPRFEISGMNGLLPSGLVHQIGIGATINTVDKRSYLVKYNDGTISGGPNGADTDGETLFKEARLNGSIRYAQLMYGLKMRAPVGKSMMINYGFRYTLDFGLTTTGLNYNVSSEIREYLFRNLIAFDLGITLPY